MNESSQTTANKILKVHSKAFQRAYHQYAFFPEIRLAGKWLSDLGFAPGQHVNIACKDGKIEISALVPLAAPENSCGKRKRRN